MKTIKYCCRNERHGSKTVYKTLKNEFPDLKQKKKSCLGSCKMCHKQCFVKIGKQNMLCAHTPDELYAELKKLIQEGKKPKKSKSKSKERELLPV
ncbi:DUF1450 domain-containing protein [Paenibacillus tarimensis]|uniref:DUF1450 domain-containing protein n=1 Tax=Paenibacillus tarimensis TaxID=416012 RepID=UPI001F48E715|nr:DUF1450 domain-containing protein [Paenibacillus tarimensis]MCF2944755.1 YuzB family protein [Paenibacillus tarimensis]